MCCYVFFKDGNYAYGFANSLNITEEKKRFRNMVKECYSSHKPAYLVWVYAKPGFVS